VVSLVSLALVPVFIQWRNDALRDETLNTTEPARQLVTEIRGALAAQVAGSRGFLLTGDKTSRRGTVGHKPGGGRPKRAASRSRNDLGLERLEKCSHSWSNFDPPMPASTAAIGHSRCDSRRAKSASGRLPKTSANSYG
jgi:hypothetical protein